MATPTLNRLASLHFPTLPLQAARTALIRLLDDLSLDVLREARIERWTAQATAAVPSAPRLCSPLEALDHGLLAEQKASLQAVRNLISPGHPVREHLDRRLPSRASTRTAG